MYHWTDDCDSSADGNWFAKVGVKVEEEIALTGKLYWQGQYGGMHRRAEFELVLITLNDHPDHKTFLELGSGEGILLKEAKERFPYLEVIGFEHRDMPLIAGVDFRTKKDIFESVDEIQEIIKSASSPIVSYNDNGHKVRELDIVSEAMRVGDIIGCHDFGTEVPQSSVGFLAERGFEIIESYEEHINNHLCLQRFWQKTK